MEQPLSNEPMKPTTDIIFQAIFGKKNNVNLLISLLNGLLSLPHEKRITELEYLSPLADVETLEDKRFLMDLFVKDAQNKRYGIEMQVRNHDGFLERMLFYACRRYAEQLTRGEDYIELKALVLLVITDFVVFPEHERWKSNFKLKEEQFGEIFTEDFSIVLVELKKFRKKIEDIANLGEKWIVFLREGTKMQSEVKDPAWMTPELKKAIEELERMEGDPAQRALYEARQRYIRLQATLLRDHFNQGMKEGKEEGIKEGGYQAKHKIAMRLISKGSSAEEISELTELSLEEIQKLRQSQN